MTTAISEFNLQKYIAMLDDDDDLDDMKFYDWFDFYRVLFPEDLIEGNEPGHEIYDFYNGIYRKIMTDVASEARKLFYRQYPELATETREALLQRIDNHISNIGSKFLIRLFNLLHDEQKGTDLRGKYPEFDKWVELYARPHDLNDVFVQIPWLTEERKQEMIKARQNDAYNWKELRKREFKDMLQTIVLRQYPQVENLRADGWIVYSYLLMVEYDDFRFDSEFFWDFIRCELPEEDLKLSYSEIHEKVMKIYMERTQARISSLKNSGENLGTGIS